MVSVKDPHSQTNIFPSCPVSLTKGQNSRDFWLQHKPVSNLRLQCPEGLPVPTKHSPTPNTLALPAPGTNAIRADCLFSRLQIFSAETCFTLLQTPLSVPGETGNILFLGAAEKLTHIRGEIGDAESGTGRSI